MKSRSAWYIHGLSLAFCAACLTAWSSAGFASVRVGGHLQLRYGLQLADDDPLTAEDESSLPWSQQMTLRRARLKFRFKRDGLRLKAHVALDKANPRLMSLYLDLKGPWGLKVRAGQSKRLLTRAYLDSSSHQRLVERSKIGDEIGSNRDIGVVISRGALRERLVWSLALWNGQGANALSNSVGRVLIESRAEATLGGKFSTEDPVIGRRLGVKVGGALAHGSIAALRKTGGQVLTRYDQSVAWSCFGAVRGWGVELVAEALWHDRAPQAETVTATALTEAGVSSTSEGGWSVQVAWQPPVFRQRLEVSARLWRWRDDRAQLDDVHDRWTAGLSWRARGDDLKLQLQGQWRHRRREGVADEQARLLLAQLQGVL